LGRRLSLGEKRFTSIIFILNDVGQTIHEKLIPLSVIAIAASVDR
jgi:hypothetical protein